jgi:hypothetical protein
MIQTWMLRTAFAWMGLGPILAEEVSDRPTDANAIYKELTKGLSGNNQRAESARLELDYWYRGVWKAFVRKVVKTRDGKASEIVLLKAPGMSVPGVDFSMAFLVVDKRVVDWTSCWTYNRTASQDAQLEDVDGDGFVDLGFRADTGSFGLLDKRKHTRPGDKRTWLYAYAITSKGFQSLFPKTDRDLRLKVSYDTAGQPVTLRAQGLPQSLREYQMYECTISAKNTSKMNLQVKVGQWLDLEFEKACGSFVTYGPWDERTVLKPGETVSHTLQFHLESEEKEVTVRFKFVPETPTRRKAPVVPEPGG